MIKNKEQLRCLIADYGDAFYLLNSTQFKKNFTELKESFVAIYPNFNIAYSYKTNYTPKLCRLVNELGGYAEVVSDMEMEIALRVGVTPEKIIWNGPYKNMQKVEELLLKGGIVNLDSIYEIEKINMIAKKFPETILNIGIRCNFDISDGVVSRFGFDVESKDFCKAIDLVKNTTNIHLAGLHCHFATRRLDTWRPRAEGMLDLLEKIEIMPDHIDLGGGLYGKMADSLKAQFDSEIPTYDEYAQAVAPLFAERFRDSENVPLLLIEPGSALVGDCMNFVSKVVNIKNVRGKAIATLLGSVYNINPTLNNKNSSIVVYAMGEQQQEYADLDFGGFTCIESDYLYRHYDGKLAVGDVVVFGNVGSYSIVLKPPFILPNFPILDICGKETEVIKRQEKFDDLFQTYNFDGIIDV
jgi:diaminopimelate decarboxylase